MRGQQSGDAPVAVGERMDAQQVELERGDDDQRMEGSVIEGGAGAGDELEGEVPGVRGGDRLEPDRLRSVGVPVDDEVVVEFEPAAATGDETEQQPMQMQDQPDAERAGPPVQTSTVGS